MSPAWDKSCQDSLIQTSKALSKFFFSKNKVEKCCDLSCQRKIFKSHNFQWCFINFVMSYLHIMEVHRGIFRILSFIMKFFCEYKRFFVNPKRTSETWLNVFGILQLNHLTTFDFCWNIDFNQFHANVSFSTHWKHPKTRGLLKFSGGYKNEPLAWNRLKSSFFFILWITHSSRTIQ